MEEVPDIDDDDDILIARLNIYTMGRTANDMSTAVFVTLHINSTLLRWKWTLVLP